MAARRFSQLDVFSATPLRGNSLAVVHGAEGLSDAQMADFARWTHFDAEVLRLAWVDNGPGWMAALLTDGARVLALQPDFGQMQGLKLGVVGPYPAGSECQFEVRAFVPDLGVPEDPVTGSLNAGLAQWLIGAGLAPAHCVAAQGAALGRAGRVFVDQDGADIWIGGAVCPVISGWVNL